MARTHSVFWLMDPGRAIGTQDNVPGPVSAGTWRVKKGLLDVMTSKTWPNPGLSHKAQNTRANRLSPAEMQLQTEEPSIFAVRAGITAAGHQISLQLRAVKRFEIYSFHLYHVDVQCGLSLSLPPTEQASSLNQPSSHTSMYRSYTSCSCPFASSYWCHGSPHSPARASRSEYTMYSAAIRHAGVRHSSSRVSVKRRRCC